LFQISKFQKHLSPSNQAGEFAEAVEVYTRALQECKSRTTIMVNRGHAHNMLGDRAFADADAAAATKVGA
jgi:formamidopyrimidine-DNA glycosylase